MLCTGVIPMLLSLGLSLVEWCLVLQARHLGDASEQAAVW